MPEFSVKQQRGYVLMITLLMFMGIGGAVLASFTKEARRDLEERKYQHNQRVLAEAKQALLMYAYNYPEIAATFNGTIRGPGRLPCPDTSAGAGTLAEKPELTGVIIILVAIPETMVILGFVVAAMILLML